MNIQMASKIFHTNLEIMKKTLDLFGFKFDKRTSEFKFMKSQVMDFTYQNMTKLFKELEQKGIIEKCPNNHNLRQGYKKCDCGGSGWINKIEKK